MAQVVNELLVATRNHHKAVEIQALLGDAWKVGDLAGNTDFPTIEETGKTFEQNATLKAEGISQLTGGLVLADDSGLVVDALGGAPGVYSSRYAGEEGKDIANNAKLLRELEHRQAMGADERSARFVCCMVIARAGQKIAAFEGFVEGRIDHKGKGKEGFGYDPLFIPTGYDQSFGELPPEVKNGLSHRSRALDKAKRYLDREFARV